MYLMILYVNKLLMLIHIKPLVSSSVLLCFCSMEFWLFFAFMVAFGAWNIENKSNHGISTVGSCCGPKTWTGCRPSRPPNGFTVFCHSRAGPARPFTQTAPSSPSVTVNSELEIKGDRPSRAVTDSQWQCGSTALWQATRGRVEVLLHRGQTDRQTDRQ
jgi:hypothetical protein